MTITKPQVCIIHGGTVYTNESDYLQGLRDVSLTYDRLLYSGDWKRWIAEQLQDFDVLLPSMPAKDNAKYDHWKLYFDKVAPYLQRDAVLVGHSLGGIFLAKYFTENIPAMPLQKLVLVAAPHSDTKSESLEGFTMDSFSGLNASFRKIHILHSKDDSIVPVDDAYRYTEDLPHADLHLYVDRGHFVAPTLPELIPIIGT